VVTTDKPTAAPNYDRSISMEDWTMKPMEGSKFLPSIAPKRFLDPRNIIEEEEKVPGDFTIFKQSASEATNLM
jgi:hypothetical protein